MPKCNDCRIFKWDFNQIVKVDNVPMAEIPIIK